MPLSAGVRLGPYEIVELLGAGGMGEVYRTNDTRLDRQVALKVIHEEFAENEEHRRRFEREARAIAALNHPRICTVHDVGRSGDTDYLVMELLHGETLATRLSRSPLPTGDVLELGAQIAEALAAAHRAGVVHRDFKPGNVMLTRTGVKLTDFGLARRSRPMLDHAMSGTQPPEESATLTMDGRILGTFAYMAPELLEGGDADARSDVWALGVTLYQMASGQPPFAGSSPASLMSAILKDTPRPLLELAPVSPPELERLVRSCLEKDPDARWQNAGDLARELRWLAQPGRSAPAREAEQAGAAKRRWIDRLPAAAAGAGAAVVIGLSALLLAGRAPWATGAGPPPVRSEIPFPGVAFPEMPNGGFAISPDGTALAATVPDSTGVFRLYCRRLNETEPRALTDRQGASMPFWSADSREIGFATDERKLVRVRATGGPLQTICDVPDFSGGAWGRDDWIVFAPDGRRPLERVRATGGSPEPVTAIDSTAGDLNPSMPVFLPDGVHFMYATHSDNSTRFSIRVGSIRGGGTRELMQADAMPRCSPDGWITFFRDRTLFAQRIDPQGRRLLGKPAALPDLPSRKTYFSLESPGAVMGRHVLAYARDDARPRQLRWFSRAGIPGPVLTSLRGPFTQASASPDGRHVAVIFTEGIETNLWLADLVTGSLSRLTDAEHIGRRPTWTANGRTLVYQYFPEGGAEVRRIDIDDASSSRTLFTRSRDSTVEPTSVSDEGRLVLGIAWSAHSIIYAQADSGYRVQTYLPDTRALRDARLSRDGHWVVFASAAGGQIALYADTFPVPHRRIRLSREAVGLWPNLGAFCLLADEIIYCAADGRTLRAVTLTREGETLVPGEPHTLFTLPPECLGIGPSPDGQRFLVMTPAGAPQAPALTLVQNWEQELGRP